jgi:DNA-binding transcriptional MocR family regulator
LLDRLDDNIDARVFSQPKLEHIVLTRMIEAGTLELAISRQRCVLAKRRHELLSILFTEFKDLLTVNAGASGYELLVRFHSRLPKEQLCNAIANSGLELNTMRICYAESSETQRIEILLPLIETSNSACNSIERLFAIKRYLTLRSVEDFAPEIVASNEAIAFAPPLPVQPIAF